MARHECVVMDGSCGGRWPAGYHGGKPRHGATPGGPMDIKRVDHSSTRTLALEASRRFSTEVIGLKEGPRPPFDFPGYWLYSGEPPADLQNASRNYGFVHLMGFDKDNPGSLAQDVGARGASTDGGTVSLDPLA